uniref:T5orf172 domain-containing protein n=1 Tax=Candidatus Kentrum sp. LFY TaxID=2126342 RepID=A0A450V7E1_9GAMM|nr:MAG: T5orf172 domain-containing protein [Candidatus Kentron sp. LFY]
MNIKLTTQEKIRVINGEDVFAIMQKILLELWRIKVAIYFIIENEDLMNQRIKIGYSSEPGKRIKALQTGNSRSLALMGWIESNDDKQLEKELHEKYSNYRVLNEWFEINNENVLEELKNHGTDGYIAIQENAGEFLGCDRDAIPEYMPPWEWADTEIEDFCPQCGCSCGLHYNENYGTERCLNCGIIDSYYDENEERVEGWGEE